VYNNITLKLSKAVIGKYKKRRCFNEFIEILKTSFISDNRTVNNLLFGIC
jgi:hypothetical protein